MTGPFALAQHRQDLTARIAAQRLALGLAYDRFERPFRLVDYTWGGVLLARRHSRLILAVPFVLRTISWLLLGGKKVKKQGKKPRGGVMKWAGRAWSAYQLYRRVVPFFG